ncbi:ATP-binding cassette domain-containing protein [Lichenicola cladoniae]|uniref:ATP-binding cassette domain-containing protein n=1 Tax=Lichenicola cladoniae TaxID=1484109 RepID=A0A6M8HRN7_9PROT|nr:ATP-binding cassette domain-containing protein [Acetobacteraceae bacterium]QKE90946.1 ATP-binding cassette domain-containing protein [Lichenicola cladoniae]
MIDVSFKIETRGLTLAFGDRVIQRDVALRIRPGSIFALMGGSGCGKSTVMKGLFGLLRPIAGTVLIDGESYWDASDDRRIEINRRYGVLFQSAALWSSLTVAENVALPLKLFTRQKPAAIADLVRLKLALVGMEAAADLMPSELSGGMRKRAGLARALALDPEVLFFDEPSAGLDPITSRRLDDLILELRGGLGTTIVLVSHELPSLFAIADDGAFLDAETQTVIASGSPTELRDHCAHPTVQAFMHRERTSESRTPIMQSNGGDADGS